MNQSAKEAPLRAFHNDPAIKEHYLDRLTADEFCAEAIRRGLVDVDSAVGFARSTRTGELLGGFNQHGYKVCTLHMGRCRRQIKLHRLIWIAVHGVPPGGMALDHINRIKDDNRIENLRLASSLLNSRNRRSYKGENNPACVLAASDVAEIRALYVEPAVSYSTLAARFGVSRSLIAQIVRGEVWA